MSTVPGKFRLLTGGYATVFVLPVCIVHSKTCGNWKLKPGDQISFSPNWASRDRMLDCNWTISADEGMLVEAKFSNFKSQVSNKDPPEKNACEYEFLKVSSGSALIGVYCGDTPSSLEHLISSDGIMKLQFHIKENGGQKLAAVFSAIKAGSVIVQNFANLNKASSWSGRTHMALEQLGSHPRRINLFHDATAQLIHEKESTGPVNLTIFLDKEYDIDDVSPVRFQSDPKQSWVIKSDGVYRQDGSRDLRRTMSSTPDHRFPDES